VVASAAGGCDDRPGCANASDRQVTGVRPEVTRSDVTLAIGGCRLRFRSSRDDVQFNVRFPHTSFIVPSRDESDCTVWCEVGPVLQLDAPVVYREETPSWEVRQAPDGRDEVTYFTPISGEGLVPRIALRFSADLGRVDMQHRPSTPGDPVVRLDFPIDEYILCRLLSHRRALVLHACSVEIGGRAIVFMGHSGAGKSTMAEIAEGAGASVLSDDRTILAVDERGIVQAHGTPWHGSYRRGRLASLPLAGIFLLVQAPRNEVVEMTPLSAISEIFVRTIQPTVLASEVALVVSTAELVAGLVPVRKLLFRPEPEAFRLASEMAGQGQDAPLNPVACMASNLP